jgi:hypothetical protein
MDLTRIRTFFLGAYHDLPNVLFVGSLILGGVSGNLSLIWVSLGLLLTSFATFIVQVPFSFFAENKYMHIESGLGTCTMFGRQKASVDALRALGANFDTLVTPSHWMAAASFFAIYNIYNSARLALRPPTDGAPITMYGTRVAFSLSVMVIGIIFMGLVLARFYTGCETMIGAVLGILLGGGLAVGYWHLLDVCGAGRIPDVLNVVNGLAPPGSGNVPIICTPPPK